MLHHIWMPMSQKKEIGQTINHYSGKFHFFCLKISQGIFARALSEFVYLFRVWLIWEWKRNIIKSVIIMQSPFIYLHNKKLTIPQDSDMY